MEFCKDCGAMIMQMGENATCTRCGTSKKGKVDLKISEKIEATKEIAVHKKKIETEPLTDEKCIRCGHPKAYFWLRQTRSSDEAPTQFYRCAKCEKQWKVND